MSIRQPQNPFDRFNSFILQALLVLMTLISAYKVLTIELKSLW